ARLGMRSISATEVPPNFMTRRAMARVIPARPDSCNRSRSRAASRRLISGELLEIHAGGKAAENVSVLVGGHPFRHRDFRIYGWNECCDFAVLDAADADALLERRIGLFVRLRVAHINDVVADVDAARPPKLLPFGEEFTVLIENLDAVVSPVGDEQAAGGIHRQAVRHVELALRRAVMAPCLDEF